MKTTISTTSQASINYLLAADRITTLLDDLGFTTEEKPSAEFIRHTIAGIIRECIEGNVSYARAVDPNDDESIDIQELVDNLREEVQGDCCGGHCGCHETEEDIRRTAEESAENFRKHINENE